jgi:hypothetical protein
LTQHTFSKHAMAHYNMNYATAIPATAVPVPPPEVPTAGGDHLYENYSISDSLRNYTPSGGAAKEINEEQVRSLKAQGYTDGLAQSITNTKITFPLRFWVIDNSGSMQGIDGHRIIQAKNNELKFAPCTRWKEIEECVSYHIQLSATLEAPTIFRLLNHPGASVGTQEFGVAQTGTEMIPTDVDKALNIMSKTRPGGVTPLTAHIREIHSTVQMLKPSLDAEGRRIAIILATDGLPSNEQGICNDFIRKQFVESLRSLEGLPVWLVIRLCTDEDAVVDFYNGLDDQLELSMDVLDDFCAEAAEVYEHNSWLNYTLPIHRLREMGYHDRVFDMIDERKLTRGELRDYCMLIFGVDQFDGVPEPDNDWEGFMRAIERLLRREKPQWNPIKKKVMPLLDLKKVNKQYGNNSGCTIM